MAIKRILAPFYGEAGEHKALEAGIALAQEYKAELTCLHISVDPADYYYPTATIVPITVGKELRESMQDEADNRAALARKVFNDLCKDQSITVDESTNAHNATARFVREKGDVLRAVTKHGRVHDTVIMSRDIDDMNTNYELMFTSGLFDTGRPMLLIPPRYETKPFDVIAIAWDGSAEAAHALAISMPLLRNASRIIIMSIGSLDDDVPSHDMLSDYLAAHQIKAEFVMQEKQNMRTGEQLTHIARQHQAQLIVTGAYTHSRLQQMVMGGVTSYMLKHAELPVFMVH